MARTMTVDPRDPNREQRLAERDRRYREAMQDLDVYDDAHLARAAIDACDLCDHEGYRSNSAVCDHVDRTDITSRGMEKVRAALAKLPKS